MTDQMAADEERKGSARLAAAKLAQHVAHGPADAAVAGGRGSLTLHEAGHRQHRSNGLADPVGEIASDPDQACGPVKMAVLGTPPAIRHREVRVPGPGSAVGAIESGCENRVLEVPAQTARRPLDRISVRLNLEERLPAVRSKPRRVQREPAPMRAAPHHREGVNRARLALPMVIDREHAGRPSRLARLPGAMRAARGELGH